MVVQPSVAEIINLRRVRKRLVWEAEAAKAAESGSTLAGHGPGYGTNGLLAALRQPR